MPVKRKKSRPNFLSRLQRSKKVRSVKAKIRSKKAELKKLSNEYKRALKSEAKKLK